jgi:hypothetical protein
VNERIKELVREAWSYADKQGKTGDEWFVEYNIKFAELITHECIDISNNLISGEGGTECANSIKNRFGIKDYAYRQVYNAFPAAISKSNLGRPLTDKERDAMFSEPEHNNEKDGHDRIRNFFLDNPDLKEIREYFDRELQLHFNKIYRPKISIDAYFAPRARVNTLYHDETIYKHYHPNSFLSAVFYIDTNDTDDITFFRKDSRAIVIETDHWNPYNSEELTIPVKAGDLIIVPSYLEHSVKRVKGKGIRNSVSLNSFIKVKGEKDNSLIDSLMERHFDEEILLNTKSERLI